MSKKQSLANEIEESAKVLSNRLADLKKDLSSMQGILKNSEAAFKQKQLLKQRELEEKQREEEAKLAAEKAQQAEEKAVSEQKAILNEAAEEPKADAALQTPKPEKTVKAENKAEDSAAQGENRQSQEAQPQNSYHRQGQAGNRTQTAQTGYNRQNQAGASGQGGYARQGQNGARPQQGGYNRQGQAGSTRPQQGSQGGYNRQGQQNGARPQQGGYTRQGQAGGARPQQGAQGGYNRQSQAGARPQGGASRSAMASFDSIPVSEKERVSNYDPNKKLYSRTNYDSDKKAPSKKELAKQKGRFDDEDNWRGKKQKKKQPSVQSTMEKIKIEHAVMTTEEISIKDLSEKLGKPAAEIIKKLFMLGIMATINNEIDYETAALVATDFGIELEQKLAKTYEETMTDADEESEEDNTEERAPIVTIMGHVDHGKTSLLDAIRNTNVTAHEAGGITQHIGAYTVQHDGKQITFLDTPGHEAFTSMRARGAQVTDIAILVVAADDGVMPQTLEAINHATAAKVPIIVAINKMDKPSANPDRVKQELVNNGIVPEEWGGDAIIVPVSAVTGDGIDNLLEMILLVADVQQYKANSAKTARGAIIEARLDKGRGPVATVLIQNGTLHIGDTVVAGTAFGRVRAMMNDKGQRVESAGPSMPVEVLGFNDVPAAGDILYATQDDKLSRQVAQERKNRIKAEQVKAKAKASLEDLFSQIKEGSMKELNLIVKADVQGSAEAVKQALEKLSNDEVRVKVIHAAVGAIKESDVLLASASNAIIIGFNVRPDAMASALAERDEVDMRMYRVIYNAIEDVEAAMKGMLDPEYKEVVIGHAEVRSTFKVPGAGIVAGGYVTDGKIQRNAGIRLLRDNIVIHEGQIDSLRRFKDDVKEVASGYECGIGIANYNDIKENDVIEAFINELVKK